MNLLNISDRSETKMKYFVNYEIIVREQDIIEADSFEEAQNKWENMALDGELCYIADENGEMVEF